MLLSVQDRLVLLSILPNEGDLTTIKIVRTLREELSFTEDEHKELEFKDNPDNPGFIIWNNEAEQNKEFDLKPVAISLIFEKLKELSKQKKLKDEHIALCEKFGITE